MSTPAPIAPPSPPGLGRAGAARSGAPPGEMSFATLLENDRARTAVAEGPHNEAQRRMSAERRDAQSDVRVEHGAQPAAKVDEQAEPAPQTEPQAPAVDPAMQSPVPPAITEPVSAPVVATTTPFADAVAEGRAAVMAPVVAEQAPATPTLPAQPARDGAAVPATPAPPAVPAQPATLVAGTGAQDAAAQAGGAEQAANQTSTDADADAAPATTAETETPAEDTASLPGGSGEAHARQGEHRPDSGPADKGGQGPVNANAGDPNANANARAFDAPSRTGVTPSRPAEAAPVAEPAPAPATTTEPSVAAVAPQSEAAPASSTPVRGATTLQHLARTIDAAMQLGHARGITRARLHLHPAELGAIELHLRHTANGMTARVVAESPEAVAVLQQAASDLRRSLEQAGITLTGLDIGARADQQAEQRTFPGAFDASSRGDDRGTGGRGYGLQPGDATDTDPALQPVRTRVPLGGGALLDVIA